MTVGGLHWAQVQSGDAALGPVIKRAKKEQLRSLPDNLTYGLLRYLNPDVDLSAPEPTIGFNYLGRMASAAYDISEDLWRPSREGLSLIGSATAVPMPGPHRRTQCHHHRLRYRPTAQRHLDLGHVDHG